MKQHYLIKSEVVGSLIPPIELTNVLKGKEEKKITESGVEKVKNQVTTKVIKRFDKLGFPLGDGSLKEEDFSFFNLDRYLSQFKKKGQRLKKITKELTSLKETTSKKPVKIIKVELDLPNRSILDGVSIDVNDFFKSSNLPKKTQTSELIKKYVDVITNLQSVGVNYIQFNDDFLSYFCDLTKIQARRKNQEMRNIYDSFLDKYSQFINTIIKKVSHANKKSIFGLHLRRKTEYQDFFFELDYAALGEEWFRDLLVDRYLLEHSDERFANYKYLEWIGKEKVVVLGLMDMSTDEVEEVDYLKYRLNEAANYISSEQLAISNGGSFTPLESINCLSVEWVKRGASEKGQWKKLERLKEAEQFIFG